MKHLLPIVALLISCYAVSQVPASSTDVMLQGFYYQFFQDKGFGDTRWATLLKDTAGIADRFDLVWLPPSSSSSDPLGYHPAQYSNQNSNNFGSRAELQQLINALHRHNTRVIADVVLNHAGNKSSWCDFYIQNFGTYGTFMPNASWITSNDEVWSSGQSGCSKSANASADDGYGSEANYAYARDWDHKNSNVQSMFKAYLKWLKTEIKYDGWRYDYCKGFRTSHVNDYNQASEPYISVMEYWDGNVNTLNNRLIEAGYNTMTFDFAAKYTAFNQGIAVNNYSKCRNAGLRSIGKSRYAVTFIDNHDTHNRNDGNEFTGNNSIQNNPNKILQANAYLLSMPGIPCVFYPHWVTFRDEINSMIAARKQAGIHSESTLTEESGSGFYRATVQGLYGSLIVKIGPNSGYADTPEGYTCAVSGTNYGIFVKQTNDDLQNTSILDGVYSHGNTLHIEGHQQEQCMIYNIAGQLIDKFQIDSEHQTVILPSAGLYIININNRFTKTTVK